MCRAQKSRNTSECYESEILGIGLVFLTFDVHRVELDEFSLSFSLQSCCAFPDPCWARCLCFITLVHLRDSRCAKLGCRRDPDYKDLNLVLIM